MMLIRNYVAASNIEGVGVFAAEPIKKGQKIWEFNPLLDQVIDIETVNQQSDHVRDFLARYCYEPKFITGKIILECDNGRFMNHS
ncbi:MAG: SET domain-containing protein-lysine N-methyltransferase, partial [Alphaproteobacteria bacterium]|nr:SET domain-containing protein-lysine N-methyltransferase [Alphaproteobacteria bacterium]